MLAIFKVKEITKKQILFSFSWSWSKLYIHVVPVEFSGKQIGTFLRSSKLLSGSNTYKRRTIRQEESCHYTDMMKWLPAHWGALEQELPVRVVLPWVEMTRPLWHHLAQSLARGHPWKSVTLAQKWGHLWRSKQLETAW